MFCSLWCWCWNSAPRIESTRRRWECSVLHVRREHFTQLHHLVTNPPQRCQWQVGAPLLNGLVPALWFSSSSLLGCKNPNIPLSPQVLLTMSTSCSYFLRITLARPFAFSVLWYLLNQLLIYIKLSVKITGVADISYWTLTDTQFHSVLHRLISESYGVWVKHWKIIFWKNSIVLHSF